MSGSVLTVCTIIDVILLAGSGVNVHRRVQNEKNLKMLRGIAYDIDGVPLRLPKAR